MTIDKRLRAILAWGSICLLAVAALAQLSAVLAAPANYFTVTPCRLFDSRFVPDAPALQSGVVRTIAVVGARGCGVPANATSVFLNVTALQATERGHLRLSEEGAAPTTSALNFDAGRTRANNVTVRLTVSGQVDAMPVMLSPTATTHLIIDVYGYYVDDVPPVAVDDAASVNEGDPPTTIDVLGNDTNPDGGPIQIDTVTQPANGTVVIGAGGADLTYEPNAAYCNTPPGTALDTFTYTLLPAGSTPTATVSVTVNCGNDAPVLGGTGTVTFTEDAGAVLVAPAITATDADSANLTTAAVTITNLQNVGSEILTANVMGTAIAASYVAPTLTLSGSDTVAAYQQVLRTVAYNNLAQNPNPATRSLNIVANDGLANSNTAVALVQVVPVNDPPVLTNPVIAYATAGNTQLHVAGQTLPGVASIADPLSALAKSVPTDPDGTPTVVPASVATVFGTFTIFSDGAFTFVPAAGFFGVASYNYEVTDSVSSVMGTINITVGPRIWYVRDVVDANNPAGGDGRSTDAFETLAPAEAASGIGHYIFVFAGNTAATPLAGGIVLKDGQKLHGEFVGLSVPGFANIVAAGARPHIVNASAGGDAVSIPATAGNRQAVEVRGLDLAGTVNGVDVTATGANAVGVTVSNNVISGAGAEGLDLNAGSTGTFIATVQANTIVSTGNGFDARRTASGQSQLAFSANTVTAGAVGVFIDGSTGSTTVTAFDSNTVSGTTVGTGVMITTAIFDAVPAGAINQVSGGATAIGVSGNGVGGSGLLLLNVAGELAFSDLDVFADGGPALFLVGTGAFNGATGTQVTVAPGVGTLRSTNGAAAEVNSATVDLQLGALSSASTGAGVSLLAVSDGTVAARFSAPSGSTISGTGGGTSFTVSGGNAGVSYGGTITNVAVGRTVNVDAWSGDDATDDMAFSGAIDENGRGIRVTNNTGSRSITFSGGMDVDSATGNIGFSATSNTNTGGLRISGTNTIDSINAAALNVANTLIGTGGLTFQSLSANGGTNGIVLTNTGTTAGLTVTGAGGAPTGGVIQSMSGNGVSLTNTRTISLSSMSITANLGSGIGGDDVTDFSLIGSSVTGNADTATGVEAGIRFDELLGACAITSTTVSGSSEDNVRITPSSGILNLTIANSTIGPNSVTTGGNGVSLIGNGSATVTTTVTGTTFTGNRGTGFLTNYTGTGSHTANVNTSIFRDNGKGLSLASNTTTDLLFNVLNNAEVVRSLGNALELITSSDATSAMETRGTFSGNVIGNNNADSGSQDFHGIAIDVRGDERALLAVNSNTIRHVEFQGIFIQDADFGVVAGPPSDHDLTIRDNSVQNIDDNSGFPCGAPWGTLVDMRHTTVACMDMAGNTSAESPFACGAAHFRTRQRDTASFLVERLTDGDGTPGEVINVAATVQAHVQSQNDAGSTAIVTPIVLGFTEAANGACVKP